MKSMNFVITLGEAVTSKDVLGKFMNMAMRRIVQKILENEVADFTGREYYKHATPKQGYRNGYEPSTLRTAEGRLNILRPQVRDSDPPFESKTWPHLKKNTDQLEHMVVEMYVRGCSPATLKPCSKMIRAAYFYPKAVSAGLMNAFGMNIRPFVAKI